MQKSTLADRCLREFANLTIVVFYVSLGIFVPKDVAMAQSAQTESADPIADISDRKFNRAQGFNEGFATVDIDLIMLGVFMMVLPSSF